MAGAGHLAIKIYRNMIPTLSCVCVCACACECVRVDHEKENEGEIEEGSNLKICSKFSNTLTVMWLQLITDFFFVLF